MTSHSLSNSDSDRNSIEHTKNVNPFLTEEDEASNSEDEEADEDDDDDAFGDFQDGRDEGRRSSMNSSDDIDDLVERADRINGFEDDFTVGDLEIAAEGKGIMPPATGIVGGSEKVETLFEGQVSNYP